MEIDHFNSATRDQMDMMTTITEEKFPDFFASYNTTNGVIPQPQFSGSSPFLNPPPNFALQNNIFTFSDGFPATENFSVAENYTEKKNSMAAMREMIFRIAAMQPIYIDPESVKPPKRRNVKISKDPQSVAARHRRERISERIRILQRLVPGGTKMDTASMLDEAIHYVKFLKTQVQSLERAQAIRTSPCSPPSTAAGVGFPVSMSSDSFVSSGKVCQLNRHLLN